MSKRLSIDTLPEPSNGLPTSQFGTKIDSRLLASVKAEQVRRRLTFRQVVEWSFNAFLAQANPTEAKKLKLSE